MFTPQFTRYVAPARHKAQIWRLLLGSVLIVAVYLAVLAAIFGGLWLLAGAGQTALWINQIVQPATPTGVLLLLTSFTGAAIGPMIAVRLLHGRSVGTLFGPAARVLRDFVIATGAVLLIFGSSLLIWAIWFDAVPNLAPMPWLALLPLTLLGLLLQTGAEELVFRGYLQQQLAARFRSPIIWMLLPSLMFGALHYDPETAGNNTWLIIAATTIFALIAADLVRVTGSIGAAWGFHFANNLIAIAVISVDGTITGVSLWVTPYGADDISVLPMLMLGDLAVMALAWIGLRRVFAR